MTGCSRSPESQGPARPKLRALVSSIRAEPRGFNRYVARRLGDRDDRPPHARQARSHRPAHPGAGAVACGVLDRWRRRADLHAEPAPGGDLLGRDALHVGRRPLCVPRDLRRADAQRPRRVDERGRQAPASFGNRAVHRRDPLSVAFRPRHSPSRQPPDPPPAQAGTRPGRGHAGEGLGLGHARVRDRRPRAVRGGGVPGGAATGVRPEPALLAEGRRRPAACRRSTG